MLTKEDGKIETPDMALSSLRGSLDKTKHGLRDHAIAHANAMMHHAVEAEKRDDIREAALETRLASPFSRPDRDLMLGRSSDFDRFYAVFASLIMCVMTQFFITYEDNVGETPDMFKANLVKYWWLVDQSRRWGSQFALHVIDDRQVLYRFDMPRCLDYCVVAESKANELKDEGKEHWGTFLEHAQERQQQQQEKWEREREHAEAMRRASQAEGAK